jgi:2-dehydro-3-deoxyphosphooctonate aldolase (KDO 8-P synthase)
MPRRPDSEVRLALSNELLKISGMSSAAVAVGVAAVFIETPPDPDSAPSDGPTMIALKDLPDVLSTLVALDRVAKAHPLTM